MFLAEIFSADIIIVIVVAAVLLFGGSAIPKLARNLGSAKTEFEKGLKPKDAAKAEAAKAKAEESSTPDAN